jgi:hypothetical protein
MAITYRSFPVITEQIRNHFWSKASIRSPEECWPWIGGTNPQRRNYGRFYIHREDFRAHRVAYVLHYGHDPGELDVCHHCDNPICVNPHHLFIGTRADNHRDMDAKGRRYLYRKLSPDQVAEIRARYVPRVVSMATLAREYGVSPMAIHKIISGKTWV